MLNNALENKLEFINNEDYFKKIIYAYKKLKQVARLESDKNDKLSFKVVSLSNEQLEKIKFLESKLGYRLVAYENNSNLAYRKNEILDGLHLLLDEYLSLHEGKKCVNPDKKTGQKTINKIIPLKKELPEPEHINEEFNGFFQ